MKPRIFIHLCLALLLIGQAYPCRMLGVIALPGQSISLRDENGNLHPYLVAELEEFRLQGGSGSWPYSNSDGWAMTSYAPDGVHSTPLTVRSEIEAFSDIAYYEGANTLLNRSDVNVLVGHLRQTSSGAEDIQNPHPFIFEDSSGRQYSFAHNGDLDKALLRQLIGDDWLDNHVPQTFSGDPWDGAGWDGVVDSELFFFWIMKNVEEVNSLQIGLVNALVILEELAPNHIKNFLLSDGNDLYAYRSSLNADIYYFDGNQEAELPWYLEISNQRAVMSTPPSSGPMANIPWIELGNKELLILRADGSSSHIHPLNLLSASEYFFGPLQKVVVATYPNPFNSSVSFNFGVNSSEDLSLNIYDVLGHLVFQEIFESGESSAVRFQWDAHNLSGKSLPAGTYIYILSGSQTLARGKLLFLK